MNWKALCFKSYFRGNYGSGENSQENWILGTVLFRSPAIVVQDEKYQEENWVYQTEGVWGLNTPEKVILARWVKTEGKGGRGCDPYEEVKWTFHPLPEAISVEALEGLAPKRQK